MNILIKISYFVEAKVDYSNAEFELVEEIRTPTFDSNGNPIKVYYKRQKFPEILVTIGNVTKILKEINKLWWENNKETLWGIARDENNMLYIQGEIWSTENANYFLELCEKFIKEVFHL